jgi:Cu-Zn family superoxide dismutase
MRKTQKFFTYNLTALLLILCLYGCDRNSSSNSNINVSDSSEMSADNNKITVNMYRLDAEQPYGADEQFIGSIFFEDSEAGMIITPNLKNLQPGAHGFHIHSNPSCDPEQRDGSLILGLAAGDHYDPQEHKQHLGPHGEGHLGDLPVLVADDNGEATITLLAPRLKVADLKDRAVIIHAGGDNYADLPAPLGGGGARQHCGVVDFSKALP